MPCSASCTKRCRTVLALAGDAYRDLGVFGAGDAAESRALDGFAADVRSVFDAPKPDT